MSLLLFDDDNVRRPPRTGIIRTAGYAIYDDDGPLNALGCTLFWAPFGIAYETDRLLKNLDFLMGKEVDYIRVLFESDWSGRSWGPGITPNYQEVLNRTINEAHARGIRTQPTLIGGQNADHMLVVRESLPVMQANVEKLAYVECVNESTRLDKATIDEMVQMAEALRAGLPETLLGLTYAVGEWNTWQSIVKQAGGNIWILHTERNEADYHWRQVRQAYDLSKGPWTASNQEGPGPQSSVGTMEEPLHCAMFRFLSHIMKSGFFTFHIGAGVTGLVDPKHGRPANLWESPNVDAQFAALHAIEQFLPVGVQNWKVINNGRDDHPLQLNGGVSTKREPDPEAGFWEGDSIYGSVNKNYAVAHQDGRFIIALTGINAWTSENTTLVGKARYRCHVQAFEPVTGRLVDQKDLEAFENWYLPGRDDKFAGLIVLGQKR